MLGAGALGVFVDSESSLVSQIVMMSIVFSLSALPSAGTWMLFGSALASLFNNPARRKWFNYSDGHTTHRLCDASCFGFGRSVQQ